MLLWFQASTFQCNFNARKTTYTSVIVACDYFLIGSKVFLILACHTYCIPICMYIAARYSVGMEWTSRGCQQIWIMQCACEGV
jgi:hypothetical protein